MFYDIYHYNMHWSVLILPSGGVREALFGDEYYRVMWGKRSGFAKVALQTQVVCSYLSSLNH